MTWYPKEFTNKVPMTDMRMRPDLKSGYPGRSYRFYKGPTVFNFGYGLSYTSYSYNFKQSTPNTINLNRFSATVESPSSSNSTPIRSLSVSKIGKDNCERLNFWTSVGVENTGSVQGKHPVLLFAGHERPGEGSRPINELVGFESVSLEPKQRGEVRFLVQPCKHLSRAEEDGSMVIEGGHRYLMVEDQKFPINIVL